MSVSLAGCRAAGYGRSAWAEADALVHIGEAGTNGPPICQFYDSPVPFQGDCTSLTTTYLEDLQRGRVYVQMERTPGEQQEIIRGQILPANFVFADGFERGNSDNW